MTLFEAIPGEIVYTSERFGDEIRETFYIREDGREVRFEYDVPVASLGFVQGNPLEEEPRVRRLREPCRDPGEADARVKVLRVSDGKAVYGHLIPDGLRVAGSLNPCQR